LSCYYARAGRKAAALKHLRRSVALGLAEAPWITKDEDLASLRGDLEFKAIVAEAARNAAKR
jgi:hypothetical protein